MNQTRLSHRHAARGFTLVELAIVLIIVTLLLGGLIPTLSTQLELRRVADTQRTMGEIREALIGYALTRGSANKAYLPCPASAATVDAGTEDRNLATGACNVTVGWLPWRDLGLGGNDAWNNRFRYLIAANASNSLIGIQLTSAAYSAPASMKISPTQEATPCTTTLANDLPAIIISYGPNGLGARNVGASDNPAPTGVDELNNAAAAPSCILSGTPTPRGSANEFDDLVVWLPFNLLASRLIAAGRLP